MQFSKMLITGGAGFIGTNFIYYLFDDIKYDGTVINVDKLTYAGNIENLADIDRRFGNKRYFFEKVDICDFDALDKIFKNIIQTVLSILSAESHVDRSIHGPKDFIYTNIIGTFNLLELARKYWSDDYSKRRFITYLQMRCMVPLARLDIFMKTPLMIPVARIPPQRHLRII